MSIKDRIANANGGSSSASQSEGVKFGEEVEDTELDAMIDELEASDDPGAPRPAWEQDDDEDESSDAAASASVDSVIDDDLEDEDDEESDSLSNSDTDAAAATSGEPQETPAIDALRSAGFSVEGMTEAQAQVQLVDGFRQLAGQYNDLQNFAKIGQEIAPHMDAFNAFRQGTPTPAPATDKTATKDKKGTTAADLLAEANRILTGVGERPEFDPAWEGYLTSRQIQFDGRMYVPAAGNTHLAVIADKMTNHRTWQNKNLDASLEAPRILAKLAQHVSEMEQAPQAGLTLEQVEQHIKVKQTAEQEQAFVDDVVRKNSNWMFQHDSKGNVLTSAFSKNKQPLLSKEGIQYFKELENLQRNGIKDSRQQHYYALCALNKSLEGDAGSGKNAGQSGDSAASSAAAAANAAAKPGAASGKAAATSGGKTPADKRIELLKKHKNRATRSSNSNQSDGGSDSGDDANRGQSARKLPSFGASLTEAFVKAGIMGRPKRSSVEDE